jgi:hypothetical protein
VISLNPVYRLFAYDFRAAASTAATGAAVVAALEDVHPLHSPRVPKANIAKNERERPDIEAS